MADNEQLVDQAELFCAALKVLCHREHKAPSAVEIGAEVGIARERAHYLANRLEEVGAIRIVPTAFDERIYLEDWVKVGQLRDRQAPPKVEQLEQQQQSQRDELSKQIDARFDPKVRAGDKQALFAELQARLRDPNANKKPNPLDALGPRADQQETQQTQQAQQTQQSPDEQAQDEQPQDQPQQDDPPSE
ncbi:MAG: hypothetical protein P9M14_07365 [Candidatus Alcyoniella australis]|nr:hypothetical protein [Candidatus Alcyoniella australis]